MAEKKYPLTLEHKDGGKAVVRDEIQAAAFIKAGFEIVTEKKK
jgi:hypothetical protein